MVWHCAGPPTAVVRVHDVLGLAIDAAHAVVGAGHRDANGDEKQIRCRQGDGAAFSGRAALYFVWD